MALTDHQLNHYLANILGIHNWEEIYLSNPVELLKKLILQQVSRVYFQNLQIASTPLVERKLPSIPEIIEINLRGEGGNCLHINYFMNILLTSIGFDVTMVAASVHPFSRNHLMNIVRISGEIYLVDVATGNAGACAIPLHALPFTANCCQGIRHEFRKIHDGSYAKVHIGPGYFKSQFANGVLEKILFHFDETPVELESVMPIMEQLWMDEEKSPFCRNFFLFRHYFYKNGNLSAICSEEEEVNLLEGEKTLAFILVFGKRVAFGSELQKEVTHFSNYEEMLPILRTYFPKLDNSQLAKSIKYLNEAIPMKFPF